MSKTPTMYYNLNVRIPQEMYQYLKAKQIPKAKWIRSQIKTLMEIDPLYIEEKKKELTLNHEKEIAHLDKKMETARKHDDKRQEYFEMVYGAFKNWERDSFPDKVNLYWIEAKFMDKFHSSGIFVSSQEILDFCKRNI